MKLIASFLLFIGLSLFAAEAQCPMGTQLGTNELTVNGDFESGNVGFTSDYIYCNSLDCQQPEAMYSVGPDPSFFNGGFSGSDHTTGAGNFFIANGSPDSNAKVWCQTYTVEPNTVYVFSYWLCSLNSQSAAILQTKASTANFYSPFNAPAVANQWAQFSGPWNSGTNTSVEFCIYDNNTAAGGNDFGIDDISFVKCECAITINAGNDHSICPGDSVQLDGSGAQAYFWNPSAGLSCINCEDPWASPDTTTTYYVSVNGVGSCFAIDSIVVTVFPSVNLNAQPDTSICNGESVQLLASGAISYQWNPSSTLSNAAVSNPIAFPNSTTTYYVNAVDVNQCSSFDSVSIIVFPPPESITVSNDTIVCGSSSVQLLASGAETYQWSPSEGLNCNDCDNPVASADVTITYEVTAIDSNGCYAGKATVIVSIDPYCIHYGLPTAFSPNGDGLNDFFNLIGTGVASFTLSIYNRWGEPLFVTTDRSLGWDGTYEGESQPVEVYVWLLDATLTDGSQVTKSGNVTLVR